MRPLIVTMGSAELSVSGVSTASEFSSAEREAGRLLFAQPWDFATAASSLESLPKMRGIEIAFAGRSNVGKSSLINALTGRNALARTSHTPGRTQELIFFSADPNLTLVDMPGYGYAAAPKDIVKAWTKLIQDYLLGRANLARVYVLIDARHGLKDADTAPLDALGKAAVSHQVVLTKADQVKAARIGRADRSDRSRAEEAAGRVPARADDLVAHRRRHAGIARGDRAAEGGARRMNSGLEGVVAADTVLSHTDGDTGTIWVRGHTIGDLVANHGFEGTVAIIWEGFAGYGPDPRRESRASSARAAERAFAQMNDWLGAAAKRPLLEGVRIALAALPEDSTPAVIAATLPVAIAALIRTREGKAAGAGPTPSLSTAADFLRMLKGEPAAANEIACARHLFHHRLRERPGQFELRRPRHRLDQGVARLRRGERLLRLHRPAAWRRAGAGARHARRDQGLGRHRRLAREEARRGRPPDGLRPPCLSHSRSARRRAARSGRRTQQGCRPACLRLRGRERRHWRRWPGTSPGVRCNPTSR